MASVVTAEVSVCPTRQGLGFWIWLVLAWLMGCGAGAPPDMRPPPNVDPADVNTDGLAFHPATASEATALQACATWLPAAGLGRLHEPILVSNEGHAVAFTSLHVLLLAPRTCAR